MQISADMRERAEGTDATFPLSMQVYLGVFGTCLSRHLRLFYQKVACCGKNKSDIAKGDSGGGKKASRRVRE